MRPTQIIELSLRPIKTMATIDIIVSQCAWLTTANVSSGYIPVLYGTIEKYLSKQTELFVLDMNAPKLVNADYANRTLVFQSGYQQEFFRQRFYLAKKLFLGMSLDSFSGILRDYKLGLLLSAIRDVSAQYIFIDDTVMDFDTFVRHVLQTDVMYYVGNIVHYII